jgi:uncharacterized repeat protein (TIGR01451 family)
MHPRRISLWIGLLLMLVFASAARAQSADLAITKTDGVTTATPGGSLTYTITASNAGPSNAPGATVADTLPAALTGTWTCVGAGGAPAPPRAAATSTTPSTCPQAAR